MKISRIDKCQKYRKNTDSTKSLFFSIQIKGLFAKNKDRYDDKSKTKKFSAFSM